MAEPEPGVAQQHPPEGEHPPAGLLSWFFPKPIDFQADMKDGQPSAAKMVESVWSYNTFQLKMQCVMLAFTAMGVYTQNGQMEDAAAQQGGPPLMPESPFASAGGGAVGAGQQPLRRLSDALTEVVFIGDLHGDDRCGREWIERTGYVKMEGTAWQWIGPEDGAIVLMGDYVDKGPSSRAVLELVRDLEQAFPTHVVAMMGNHDLFMLLDATLSDDADRPMAVPVFEYSYAFMHPQTYIESGWVIFTTFPELSVGKGDKTVEIVPGFFDLFIEIQETWRNQVTQREDDAELLALLLTALQEVYKANDEQQTMMPSTPARKELLRQKPGAKDLFTSAAPFQGDADLGERARERLHLWQVEYASGLVESGLADWLRGRPLLAVVGDALVLHGGIPLALLQRVAEQQRLQLELAGGEADGAAALGDLAAALDAASNQAFARSWRRLGGNGTLAGSVEANSIEHGFNSEALLSCYPLRDCHDLTLSTDLISEIVQSRGYFDPRAGCDEVAAVLDLLAPHTVVRRIVVGHTPGDSVRESCGGQLLAVDASLSRHYRAYGNHYCPIDNHRRLTMDTKASAEAVNKVKGDGNLVDTCAKQPYLTCQGTVAKILRETADVEWPAKSTAISSFGSDATVPTTEDDPWSTLLGETAYAIVIGLSIGAFAKSAGLWG